jgi:hypothetical protein
MMSKIKIKLLAFVLCLVSAQVANADVIYKCGKGSNVVYQDEPCKPGRYQADVLTARNAKGTVNFMRGDNATKSGSGAHSALDAPRVSDADMRGFEEAQRLLGKPSVKDQLAAPTAIESRTRLVWNGVKKWFGSLFE